ncbi:putative serine/threonine protein kinase [Blattamonas nauphoetae]|uniref:non-specific serine/threonine protein kinase n=1 Tax=Blattamonas nauphoetae TaxID=2049346 RepID=A0ABQ9X5Q0_9EUKA|nr:putative serine/threonine protein kinase [Blattamonas nauphoetae]
MDDISDTIADCTLADFEVIRPITRGAFGRVLLVKLRNRKNQEYPLKVTDLFAMKVLHRSGITQSKVQKRLILEYEILENLSISHNNFIVNLVSSFQTQSNFYLIMQFQPGGDLFSFLTAMTYFDEDVAKQYLCEIVLAVEFLHSHNIVHCDLKPDNLLIGADGHLRLTDFGLSFEAMFDQVDEDSDTPTTDISATPHSTALPHTSHPVCSTVESPPKFRNLRQRLGLSELVISTNTLSTRKALNMPLTSSVISPNRFAQMTFDTTDSENDPNPDTSSKPSFHSPLLHSSNSIFSSSSPERNTSPRSPDTPPTFLRRCSVAELPSKLANTQTTSFLSEISGSHSEKEDNSSDSTSQDTPEEDHPTLSSLHIRGTPDYIAPEIIQASPYSTTFSVDWWAVGIIFFEMLSGITPFNAPTRDEVFDRILENDIDTAMTQFLPEEVSEEARSLIRGLLNKNPEDRLGTKNGVSEIKNHPFFVDVDWDTVSAREPVFSPSFDEEVATQYFDARDERFPVKAIATDDVSEDIMNARKERALQHFNELSRTLKRITKQHHRKRSEKHRIQQQNLLKSNKNAKMRQRKNFEDEHNQQPRSDQQGNKLEIPPFRNKTRRNDHRKERKEDVQNPTTSEPSTTHREPRWRIRPSPRNNRHQHFRHKHSETIAGPLLLSELQAARPLTPLGGFDVDEGWRQTKGVKEYESTLAITKSETTRKRHRKRGEAKKEGRLEESVEEDVFPENHTPLSNLSLAPLTSTNPARRLRPAALNQPPSLLRISHSTSTEPTVSLVAYSSSGKNGKSGGRERGKERTSGTGMLTPTPDSPIQSSQNDSLITSNVLNIHTPSSSTHTGRDGHSPQGTEHEGRSAMAVLGESTFESVSNLSPFGSFSSSGSSPRSWFETPQGEKIPSLSFAEIGSNRQESGGMTHSHPTLPQPQFPLDSASPTLPRERSWTMEASMFETGSKDGQWGDTPTQPSASHDFAEPSHSHSSSPCSVSSSQPHSACSFSIFSFPADGDTCSPSPFAQSPAQLLPSIINRRSRPLHRRSHSDMTSVLHLISQRR